MGHDDLPELMALEREGWTALCEGRGDLFYGEMMIDDGLMILVNGMILDREQVVASLDGAPAWDRFEITDPRLVTLSDAAATLVYTARAERAGDEPLTALMASTYRRLVGRWRLAVYQQTSLPTLHRDREV